MDFEDTYIFGYLFDRKNEIHHTLHHNHIYLYCMWRLKHYWRICLAIGSLLFFKIISKFHSHPELGSEKMSARTGGPHLEVQDSLGQASDEDEEESNKEKSHHRSEMQNGMNVQTMFL